MPETYEEAIKRELGSYCKKNKRLFVSLSDQLKTSCKSSKEAQSMIDKGKTPEGKTLLKNAQQLDKNLKKKAGSAAIYEKGDVARELEMEAIPGSGIFVKAKGEYTSTSKGAKSKAQFWLIAKLKF